MISTPCARWFAPACSRSVHDRDQSCPCAGSLAHPVSRSVLGEQFVCTASLPCGLYLGLVVDEVGLPVFGDDSPSWPKIGIWGSQSWAIVAPWEREADPVVRGRVLDRLAGSATFFGDQMVLSDLVELSIAMALRDRKELDWAGRPELLASYAAKAVIWVASKLQLIGGPQLDAEVASGTGFGGFPHQEEVNVQDVVVYLALPRITQAVQVA